MKIRKEILFVAQYSGDTESYKNHRANFSANLLSENDFQVTFITSTFSHLHKDTKNIKNSILNNNIKEIYLWEPGYKKNIGLNRVLSHLIFSLKLLIFISFVRKKYDMIFITMPPPISALFLIMKFKKKSKIVVDVLDIWPEAFGILKNSFVKKIIFYFMNKLNRFIYKNVDAIFTVSDTYKKIISNHTSLPIDVIYIGTSNHFEFSIKKQDFFSKRIVYVGKVSASYDFPRIMQIMAILNQKDPEIVLDVYGQGPDLEYFKDSSAALKICINFHGHIPYEELSGKLKGYHYAFNFIKNGAGQSITNKICDYVCNDLFIFNSHDNSEIISLLEKYKIGIDITHTDNELAAAKILECMSQKTTSKASSTLLDKFNRSLSYKKLLKKLNNGL